MESKTLKTHDNAACSFLGSVARAYMSRYDDMSDICFVFPNKRSRSFFLKELASNLEGKPMMAPEVLDIAGFMSRVSGLEEASRIDLLFRLYNVYCSLRGKSENLRTENDLLDFDRFASWGEVLIGDFSEVEQYCADAEKLFENVRNYRNISSNFLTEDQLDVIERYFGYRPMSENAERFWKSVYENESPSVLKNKFIELWKLLPELYEGLLNNLDADRLALPGTTFRRAAQRVITEGLACIPWAHVVMVGFNMLSTSEAELFEALRNSRDRDNFPFAEFFWDATGPVLGAGSTSRGQAVADMKRYMREFPMPEWAMPFVTQSNVKGMTPAITVSAAPSNVAQTKIAASLAAEWQKAQPEIIENAKAAIVLPDENLLLPLLHSIPGSIDKVNLTMGYPMRYTAVSSFMYHLRRLQMRRRKTGNEVGYYFEDIRIFLAHPLMHVVIGTSEANKINTRIAEKHIHVVTPSWLSAFSVVLAEILRPIPKDYSVSQAGEYLEGVLEILDNALHRETDGLVRLNTTMERTQISTYRKALITLLNSVERHHIEMNFMTLFHLIDRLVGGEKVNFEGEPLEGLQVMGMLETRAIDFDYVIVLSMNDKVMPRRSRRRSFIPDSLRYAYGLPTSSRSEELYSYYFYRLLSRAKDVTLIYDARAGEGMRSGGVSRFIMQLEMLYARDGIKKKNYTFMLDSAKTAPQPVEKTPEIMELLELYRTPNNGRNLSASALMNYCQCQVRFLLKNVYKINDDRIASDYIDPITQGNIVHDAMLELYFPEGKREEYLAKSERILLTPEVLKKKFQDVEEIRRAVTRAVNFRHYRKEENLDAELQGRVAMVAERLVSQIRDVMKYDMGLAPIELIGGEMDGNVKWETPDGREINLRYAFDRVDRIGDRLRIVDYKTGKAHVKADTFDEVFSGASSSKYVIQLLLYSQLLEDHMRKKEGMAGCDVEMLIYDVNVIGSEGAVIPEIEKSVISSHRQVSEMFRERLNRIFSEIFDPKKPFMPAEDESNCKYCSFQTLCGRNVSD